MRILHISTRLILGGSQENTVLSCEGQADAGHAVGLAFGPVYGPEGSLRERAARHGGIELFEIPSMYRHLHPWHDAMCLRQLRRLIREFRPDVVHTHSSKAGILGRMAAWRERVPCIVHTIHGLAFHRYASWWSNALYVATERFAATRCHAIVCVADAMAVQALAKGIGTPEQFITIRSGLDTAPFLAPSGRRAELRARAGCGEGEVLVGTIARLAELKGHDDLLEALAGELRGLPVRLVWVGDGWWRERLARRAAELGVADRVSMVGLVDPSEIPGWIEAMDIVAHPSYREGLPRAVVQGLLGGKPAICYDLDGAPEVCLDGVTGLLVPPGDRAGLARAIRRLAEDPGLRRRMGEEGRRRCAAEFTASGMVQRLLTLYERILADGRTVP